MKIFNKSILVLFAAAILVTGCKKDEDPPTITVTAPAEHMEFDTGDTIHVHATFADNENLASYSMEVGDMDGEHIMDFHHDDAATITGASYDFETMVIVPDSATVAMFYLHFSVVDEEGNEGTAMHMLHIR